jgi:hypothetical protein
MYRTIFLFASALLFMLPANSFGQELFTNCSAAFLDNGIIVDEYSPSGICKLPAEANGLLTVCAAAYNNNRWISAEKLEFKLAIRDGNTGTLYSFSDERFTEIDVQKVLAKCRKGDSIVVMTVDNKYALPHNAILVE